jgi:hypothetical protein
MNPGPRPGQIQKHHVGALLHPFDYNFATIREDVEVANVEVGGKVGQLPLGACLQVDQPEILMLDLSSKQNERPSSR